MQTCEHYLRFDPYQFAGRGLHPVHAEMATDGEIHSTGIAFEDYTRMQTQTHKVAPSRRLETPTWVMNDNQFQQVLARYIERRAFRTVRRQFPGTPGKRIAHAEKYIRDVHAPEHTEKLKRHAARYMELKRTGAPAGELHKLEQKIEEIDSYLHNVNRPTALAAAVAYHYYRVGMTSVGVAQACRIKPPLVRQITFRLNQVAAELGFARQQSNSPGL